MRVIHIIPSAFHYFDDIRTAAFELVEKSAQFGVEAEAFTLQYNSTVSKSMTASVQEHAPSRSFVGMTTLDDVFDALDEFDIVHLHVPLFGGAKQFLRWRHEHDQIPLVVTYYRPSVLSDVFSYWVYIYNWYYLEQLCRTATVVLTQPLTTAVRPLHAVQSVLIDSSYMLGGNDLTELFKEVQLSKQDTIAAKYALVYEQLISQ